MDESQRTVANVHGRKKNSGRNKHQDDVKSAIFQMITNACKDNLQKLVNRDQIERKILARGYTTEQLD